MSEGGLNSENHIYKIKILHKVILILKLNKYIKFKI